MSLLWVSREERKKKKNKKKKNKNKNTDSAIFSLIPQSVSLF